MAQFTSETARKARNRRFGLKAWQTRIERGEADKFLNARRIALVWMNRTRSITFALKALRQGYWTHRCSCPFHYASKYGFDIRVMENELARLNAMRDSELRQALSEWKASRTKAALLKAQERS